MTNYGRACAALAVALLAASASWAAEGDGYIFRYRLAPIAGGIGTPGQEPGPATGSRFVPAASMPTISSEEGEPVRAVIGTYEGDPGQWACDPIAGASWLSCSFADGDVSVGGTAPAATQATVSVTLRRPGYSAAAAVPVAVRPVTPSYSVIQVPNLYVVAGGSDRVPIGTFKGSVEGWSCKGRSSAMAAWQRCEFDGGKVFLAGQPPAGGGMAQRSYDILRNGETMGQTSLLRLYWDTKGYEFGAATTESPRSGSVEASNPPDLYAVAGKPFRIRLGTYSGGDGGWTCAGEYRALATWMSCEFRDGGIFLVGTPPAGYGGHQNSINVVRDGRVVRYLAMFIINHDAKDYVFGAATPETPRAGSVDVPNPPDLYAVAGQPFRLRLGTYSGGDGGWTCGGDYRALASWVSCEFRDGEIFLVGTAPSGYGGHQNTVDIVRDGRVIRTTSMFILNHDVKDYVHGAPVTHAPRTGSAAVPNPPDLYAVAGKPFRLRLGTYSGGDGGWACAGGYRALATWASCEFTDGQVFLVGAAPSGSGGHQNTVALVRDGRVIRTSSMFILGHDTKDYAHGAAMPDEPRSGTVSLSSMSDTNVVAGEPYRLRVGSYSGGDGGWTCGGDYRGMASWVSCDFEDGGIFLVGTPSAGASSSHQNSYSVVRDGRVLGTVRMFILRAAP